MTAADPVTGDEWDGPRVTQRGCSVKDDGRPGPCGLDISEHNLSEDGTAWLHPVGLNAKGYWTFDEEETR